MRELITGCMFAGKTSEMLRRMRRESIAGKATMLVCHASDTRYTSDGAVPPWLLRGADPEAVTLDVTRALPLEPGGGSAHRGLQSSSDACDYVSVSGSTYQSGRHGLYEATGTCSSAPSTSRLKRSIRRCHSPARASSALSGAHGTLTRRCHSGLSSRLL